MVREVGIGNVADMLFAALRDMQWRRRRFFIAIVSTGLVFAMTLVLTGLANGFRVEAERTVDSMGVDAFVIPAGANGPFLGATPFAPVDLAQGAGPIASSTWFPRSRRRTGHPNPCTWTPAKCCSSRARWVI
jgi:hypothetical protein